MENGEIAVYFAIMGGLVFAIFFVSLFAYRLSKGNKEARRIMDRFYAFVAMTSTEAQIGTISKEQEKALINVALTFAIKSIGHQVGYRRRVCTPTTEEIGCRGNLQSLS